MNKPIWLSGLVIVTLVVTSCGGSRNKQVATSPVVSISSAGSPAPTTPGQQSAKTSSSAAPAQKSALQLIQPTDPAQRAQQAEDIIAGRSDPFAPTSSRVVSPTPANPGTQPLPQLIQNAPMPLVGQLPQLPPVVVTAPMPIPPAPSLTQLPTLPTTVQPPGLVTMAPQPVAVPAAPPVAARPQTPPAPASLARAIQVMGVVQTRGKMSAIIEVPGEGTPRAVTVGERLGNGTVLVKRIEANGSQEPIVVLEEHGKEIPRAVGSATISTNPVF